MPEVAAAHRMNPAGLRRTLREDETLWVDPDLRLFFVDPPLEDGDSHHHDGGDERHDNEDGLVGGRSQG